MSELMHKKHNVSVLLYHLVCPTKYRRAVSTADVDEKLKEICEQISLRYEIEFLEIGTDSDHVHFLVQSVPLFSPTKIVTNQLFPNNSPNANAGTRTSGASAATSSTTPSVTTVTRLVCFMVNPLTQSVAVQLLR